MSCGAGTVTAKAPLPAHRCDVLCENAGITNQGGGMAKRLR